MQDPRDPNPGVSPTPSPGPPAIIRASGGSGGGVGGPPGTGSVALGVFIQTGSPERPQSLLNLEAYETMGVAVVAQPSSTIECWCALFYKGEVLGGGRASADKH